MNKDRELEEKKYPCVDCGKLRTAGEGGRDEIKSIL